MIRVKKINQQELVVNCDLIESIEFNHHAVISLTTGEKIIVDESPDDIIRKVVHYKRAINDRAVEFRVVPKDTPEA